MPKFKTPGADGLSSEFYLCFWDKLVDTLHSAYNLAFSNKKLHISARHGIITLIPKNLRIRHLSRTGGLLLC